MDVHLLVYDLSRGLARDMSMGLLGFQLDAIYHTSVQLNGREYVYDGGIVSIIPGSSHLGRPLQQIPLGRTELPMDIIDEYLDSLRPIFTAEAYDLWKHNCNNFSDSFAKFLLGNGIPDHILHMPQAVLDSPLGQMLLPQLNQSINANRPNGSILGIESSSQLAARPSASSAATEGKVKVISSLPELNAALEAASESCAVVFFTSATCGPCRALYPLYEELAAEVGSKGSLIKVDIGQADDVGRHYGIRATPTFQTFVRGQTLDQWSGADPARLRGDVRLLVSMAFPHHKHEDLYLPSLRDVQNAKPVLYQKIPPMAKLLAKLPEERRTNPTVVAVRSFVEVRAAEGPAQATLPDLNRFASFLRESVASLPPELAFTVVDLLRIALVDPRVSGHFAEEKGHSTITAVLDLVNGLDACPYALRLVTLQMACNLFASPLYADVALYDDDIRKKLVQLISTSFLDDGHDNVRVSAASLTYNMAMTSNKAGLEAKAKARVTDEDEVEIAASLLEAISQEEKSVDALHGMLLALGHLVYRTDVEGQLADLLRVMDAEGTVKSKRRKFPNEPLVKEVGEELLGKGLVKA